MSNPEKGPVAMTNITRREFLSASADFAALTTLAGCSTSAPVSDGGSSTATDGGTLKMQAILISSAS